MDDGEASKERERARARRGLRESLGFAASSLCCRRMQLDERGGERERERAGGCSEQGAEGGRCWGGEEMGIAIGSTYAVSRMRREQGQATYLSVEHRAQVPLLVRCRMQRGA